MENNNRKPLVIEMLVDEMDQTGVDIISFVENPAIEVDFLYFNDKKKDFKFKATSEDKRLVTGPAMLPNEKIIRMDAEGEPYFVFFSEDTIRLCNELYFKQSKQNTSNVDHEEGVDNVTVIESWIIEDNTMDKALALGFEGLPKGTWMITYKVYNDELWDKVKAGEVLGFSVEGMFGQKLIEMSEEKPNDKLKVIDNMLKEKKGIVEETEMEEESEMTEEELISEIQTLLESGKSEEEIYDEIKEKLK